MIIRILINIRGLELKPIDNIPFIAYAYEALRITNDPKHKFSFLANELVTEHLGTIAVSNIIEIKGAYAYANVLLDDVDNLDEKAAKDLVARELAFNVATMSALMSYLWIVKDNSIGTTTSYAYMQDRPETITYLHNTVSEFTYDCSNLKLTTFSQDEFSRP